MNEIILLSLLALDFLAVATLILVAINAANRHFKKLPIERDIIVMIICGAIMYCVAIAIVILLSQQTINFDVIK